MLQCLDSCEGKMSEVSCILLSVSTEGSKIEHFLTRLWMLKAVLVKHRISTRALLDGIQFWNFECNVLQVYGRSGARTRLKSFRKSSQSLSGEIINIQQIWNNFTARKISIASPTFHVAVMREKSLWFYFDSVIRVVLKKKSFINFTHFNSVLN